MSEKGRDGKRDAKREEQEGMIKREEGDSKKGEGGGE